MVDALLRATPETLALTAGAPGADCVEDNLSGEGARGATLRGRGPEERLAVEGCDTGFRAVGVALLLTLALGLGTAELVDDVYVFVGEGGRMDDVEYALSGEGGRTRS